LNSAKEKVKVVAPVLGSIIMIIALIASAGGMREDFKKSAFMTEKNHGALLVPTLCNSAGEEGEDFIRARGWLKARRGRSAEPACWYTLDAFHRLFPESSSETDSNLVRGAYDRIGFIPRTPTPWENLISYAAITALFVLTAVRALFFSKKAP